MTAPFTPGPWRETVETRAIEICTIHGCSPRSTTEPKAQRWLYIVSDNSGSRSEEEQDANARLIAAAPELYEALDALLDYHNEGRIPERAAIDKAEAAISKARGEFGDRARYGRGVTDARAAI